MQRVVAASEFGDSWPEMAAAVGRMTWAEMLKAIPEGGRETAPIRRLTPPDVGELTPSVAWIQVAHA